MISVGENKAVICKGDFHPAALYKGDKKIAGYNVEEFESENGVTLENCYNDKLHNTQIFGNSIQDGTPTPENPIEVQSVGELVTEGEYAGKYKVSIKARGKNLFDMLVRTVNYATEISYENGIQYCRGNAGNAYAGSGGQLRLKFPTIPANKKITISFYGTCIERGAYNDVYTQFLVGYDYSYHEEMRRIIWYGITGEKRKHVWTFTTTRDVNSFEMRLANSKWAIELNTFQIEIGDTATPYEPYIEPQTFNIYLDEPLGRVAKSMIARDYVDFDKKVVVRNAVEVIITSDMVRSKNSSYKNYGWNAYLVHLPFYLTSGLYNCSGFSNYFKNPGGNSSAHLGDNYVFQLGNNNNNYLYIVTTPFSDETLEEIKAWVDEKFNEGNPLKFLLWRRDLVEEPIDLPELPTFKGTTIYEIDTDITATISGKYKRTEE